MGDGRTLCAALRLAPDAFARAEKPCIVVALIAHRSSRGLARIYEESGRARRGWKNDVVGWDVSGCLHNQLMFDPTGRSSVPRHTTPAAPSR